MTSDTQRRAVLNEFGDVEAAMKAWTPPANPHAARYAELHAIILSWGDTEPAEQPYALETKRFTLDMKPRMRERDMGPAAQRQFFQRFEKLELVVNHKVAKFDPFLVFATTIGAIKEHLGQNVLDEIAPHERTGVRKFEVKAKSTPAVGKAA